MKQYKYIGKDPQKKGLVAEADTKTKCLYVVDDWYLPKEMIENEPDIWEEMKEEDVFEKMSLEIFECAMWCITDRKVNKIKEIIKKHLWITKEEIINYSLWEKQTICIIEKLFSDRWLLMIK